MIPYLLADNPQMTKEEAFAESKSMMQGQKWKAFVLDLSFIGWDILSGMTMGILGIFYVQPYKDGTHAALYEALRYGVPYHASLLSCSFIPSMILHHSSLELFKPFSLLLSSGISFESAATNSQFS